MSVRVSGKVWLIGLLVLGLTASLLGAAPPGAVGTHGDDADVDYEPSYSACVGAATESFGFEDTEGSFAEEAINCLAHYGITTGRSATMFAPNDSVLRWQMALFLARAAAAAGIVLANPATDQGFTDVGGVSGEARNAINGLAAAGIMPGTSQTTFSPNSSVTRGSMAVLLDAFLARATLGAGAFGGEIEKHSDIEVDNFNVFSDIDGVSLNTYNAIYRIYEVGVTQGVGDHQFGPGRNVTRAQMAAFITRAFAHTVARPAGVSIQAEKDSVLGESSVQLIVSVRDAMFQPVVDASVDVFRSTDPDNALKDDGTCDTASVSQVAGIGRAACEVDTGDETTDAAGDVTALQLQVSDADVTVWAWTGDRADKFDSDDTTAAQLTVGFSKAASQLLVTDNLEEGQTHLQFGETATLTVQVANEDDEPVAEKDVGVKVAQVTTPDVSKTTETNSSTNTYTTDASGKFQLSFTQTDPSSGDDEDATVVVTLSEPSSYTLQDEDGEAFASKTYTWSDEAGVPAKLVLETRQEYAEASDEGRGAVAAVTATLTDQFGNPVRGQRIHFWSDDPAGVGQKSDDIALEWVRNAITLAATGTVNSANVQWRRVGFRILRNLMPQVTYTRTTNRSGAATLSYSRDATGGVIETIRARLVRGEDDATTRSERWPWSRASEAEDPRDLVSERATFYWAEELDDDDSAKGRILVKDADARRLVFGADDGRVRMITYDGNDQFRTNGTPIVMSEFEKYLKGTAAHIIINEYSDTASDVSSFDTTAEWPQVDMSKIPVPQASGRTVEAVGNGMVILAADGGAIVVGSFWENNYAGAVYVFDGVDDDAPQKLTAPTPQPTTFTDSHVTNHWYNKPWEFNLPTSGGHFGYAVDIRGDTIVVGEPGRLSTHTINKGTSDPRTGVATDGAVYVYTKNASGTWELDATLTLADFVGSENGRITGGWDAGMELGRSVVVSEDETTIAASAPRFLTNQNSRRMGGVHIFKRPDQTGRNTATIGKWDDATGAATSRLDVSTNYINTNKNSGNRTLARDRELAISRDGSTVVVGNSWFSRVLDNVKHDWVGGAFIYTAPSGGWVAAAQYEEDTVLQSPTPYSGERMAVSLGVSADGSTVVVSAHFRPELMRQGKVLIYERPDQSGRSAGDKWGDADNLMDPSAVLTHPLEHPDKPDGCLASAGPVLGCNIGETFGQWVDINDAGDRILAAHPARTEGRYLGSTRLFTEPAGGWSTVTADNQPSSVEFLGADPGAFAGWRNHFDQDTGDIYMMDSDPDANGAVRAYKITP